MLDKLLSKCYTLLKKGIFLQRGRNNIRKLGPARKKWHDTNSRNHNKPKKKKGQKNSVPHNRHTSSKNTHETQKYYRVHAPSIFSMENNPGETIKFFNDILEKRRKFGATIFIDSEKVTEVTVDALMYLIAIICDARSNQVLRLTFRGNMPKDTIANKVYTTSGFLDFVAHNGTDIIPQSNNIKIIKGKLSDPDVAKQMCDFVQSKSSYDIKATRPLYEILVELMGNTKQHAYEEVSGIGLHPAKNWFVYVEEKDDAVEFVFLDTGLGIPATVSKKIFEKVVGKRDSALIVSALKGEYRSKTKKKNRGKGLPQISQYFQKGFFKKAFIFSGEGCCYLDNETKREYIEQTLPRKLFGTLFTWTLLKGVSSI